MISLLYLSKVNDDIPHARYMPVTASRRHRAAVEFRGRIVYAPSMLLYVHVPFCRKKCGYCSFYSLPVSAFESESPHALSSGLSSFKSVNGACTSREGERADAMPPETSAGRQGFSPGHAQLRPSLPQQGMPFSEAEAAWYKAVMQEMDAYAPLLRDRTVESIFFGGGTPSLVDPRYIPGLIERAARDFRLAPGLEISMEANPDSVSLPAAQAWLKGGVNRVSLGVQSLDDAGLAALGRVHDSSSAIIAFHALRKAGFADIGMDLIWGQPGQGIGDWLDTLKTAADMQPEHLSCYGLSVEEGTPFADACRMGRLHLPDEDAQARMYLEGSAFLRSRGYEHYEISNLSQPGHACRHNSGYWTGSEYLGIGPSAVSRLEDIRFTAPADLAAWLAAAGRPKTAPLGLDSADHEVLDDAMREEEEILLSLRMARGLDTRGYALRYGREFAAGQADLCRSLIENGLAVSGNGRFALTEKGWLVSNDIIARFIAGILA
ncbi:MAG: coproporphyrinogen III oxidase family protein [Mailhella sp.]|nr:coproporphyrinogen III oxidase family protein [Mailhella sp.]